MQLQRNLDQGLGQLFFMVFGELQLGQLRDIYKCLWTARYSCWSLERRMNEWQSLHLLCFMDLQVWELLKTGYCHDSSQNIEIIYL